MTTWKVHWTRLIVKNSGKSLKTHRNYQEESESHNRSKTTPEVSIPPRSASNADRMFISRSPPVSWRLYLVVSGSCVARNSGNRPHRKTLDVPKSKKS